MEFNKKILVNEQQYNIIISVLINENYDDIVQSIRNNITITDQKLNKPITELENDI